MQWNSGSRKKECIEVAGGKRNYLNPRQVVWPKKVNYAFLLGSLGSYPAMDTQVCVMLCSST